ncbi:hypothetical protein RRG08_040389 [Elysia crispata]|uniref:Uncharacterized protein n=1 Tax=Elysia crispata TaxID=231223 RepID=A0AAE1A386_9GAST|nr:hypothetical protein RRG08_040389 [Elysia crispata]
MDRSNKTRLEDNVGRQAGGRHNLNSGRKTLKGFIGCEVFTVTGPVTCKPELNADSIGPGSVLCVLHYGRLPWPSDNLIACQSGEEQTSILGVSGFSCIVTFPLKYTIRGRGQVVSILSSEGIAEVLDFANWTPSPAERERATKINILDWAVDVVVRDES